jgi:transposase
MQRQCTKLDFTGQQIFVGIDVHKKSWTVAIVTEQHEHKTFTQPPRAEVLVNYLRRTFPGAAYHCVYEAGFCGFWIHDELQRLGAKCLVVNPADVPTKHKELTRKKNPVDARKLARTLRTGELDPIYVPTRQQLEDRSLVRSRIAFGRKLTRCKNQVKAVLHFYGIPVPEDIDERYWSLRFIRWLEQLSFQRPSGTQALHALLAELHQLRQVILTLTRHIRHLACRDPYQDFIKVLITIPGISVLTAMVLATELITLERFASEDALSSYCGLVPGEYSSGEDEFITGLSPRRNPFLRFLLIEAAWVAVRRDPALMMAFQTLTRRMSKSDAIVRIARKLLRRIRFVWSHRQPYCMATTTRAA